MAILPKSELKGVYSALLRMHIQEYLISDEFKYFCLEKDLDQFWDQSNKIAIQSSNAIVLIPGYTGDAEVALFFFLNILYNLDKKKFETLISELLLDFLNWSPEIIDFTHITTKLKEIGIDLSINISEQKNKEITLKTEYENSMTENKVFIVHGHDNELKVEVELLIKTLDLEPIVLHRQPNHGQTTIIEKFEECSSECKSAIVLLTPDDIGKKNDESSKLLTRARQNVVFEMGYFFKQCGRGHVFVLNDHVEEIPSDYAGILYINVDNSKKWKSELVTSLHDAGYKFSQEQVLNAIR